MPVVVCEPWFAGVSDRFVIVFRSTRGAAQSVDDKESTS
jgi:hypothetical protein